jgi:hypothetical protein
MSALLPEFRYPPKVRISFTSDEVSTAIPIATLVGEIRTALGKLIPSAVRAWSRDAMQWGACCGDLAIVAESCLIYASILTTLSYPDAFSLIRSVSVVLKSTSLQRRTEVFRYVRAVLTCLASIIHVAVAQQAGALFLYVFDFAAHFVNIVSIDLETASAALRVLTIFITNGNLAAVERIAPRMVSIAKMLPVSFNDGSVLNFLTALIVHLPPATSQTLKVIALALLLPVFFTVVSAYHSVDPFSTFVEDRLVVQLFNCANAIGAAEFAGDSRYSEILVKYFDNDGQLLARHTPDLFIQELTEEMWNSDSGELSVLGRFYAEMVKMDSSTVNSAVFTVARLFILSASDKPAICRIFTDVICLAIASGDREARDLIGAFGKVVDIFSGEIQTPGAAAADPAALLAAVGKAVGEAIDAADSPIGKDSLVLQGGGCVVPMVPLPAERPRFLAEVRLQPFAAQREFWEAVRSAAPAAQAEQSVQPSAFDIYAHCLASAKAGEQRKSAPEGANSAQTFILRDEELAGFETRCV